MLVGVKQQCAVWCLCFETSDLMTLAHSEIVFLNRSSLWFLVDATSEAALRKKCVL